MQHCREQGGDDDEYDPAAADLNVAGCAEVFADRGTGRAAGGADDRLTTEQRRQAAKAEREQAAKGEEQVSLVNLGAKSLLARLGAK
eukprot:gene35335-38856_t